MRNTILVLNLGLNDKNKISFTSVLPSKEEMFSILHKIIETSWKVNIDSTNINKWLDNFTGLVYDVEDEQRIALWLLCNYTFYPSEDVNHLCKILFNKFIHDYISRNNFPTTDIDKALNRVFFSSIGSASESGGVLLYHFRQEAHLALERFFYPTEIEAGEDNIAVFIDDVTLSGKSAERFYNKKLKDKKFKHIYYLTIISSKEAIDKIRNCGIIPIYCTLVDDRHKCFSNDSMVFLRYPTLKDAAKLMVQKYGEKLVSNSCDSLGFKGGEFCFGFYYNTPNNTLPIFWSNLNNWYPIFPRKEKIYNGKKYHFDAHKFI